VKFPPPPPPRPRGLRAAAFRQNSTGTKEEMGLSTSLHSFKTGTSSVTTDNTMSCQSNPGRRRGSLHSFRSSSASTFDRAGATMDAKSNGEHNLSFSEHSYATESTSAESYSTNSFSDSAGMKHSQSACLSNTKHLTKGRPSRSRTLTALEEEVEKVEAEKIFSADSAEEIKHPPLSRRGEVNSNVSPCPGGSSSGSSYSFPNAVNMRQPCCDVSSTSTMDPRVRESSSVASSITIQW